MPDVQHDKNKLTNNVQNQSSNGADKSKHNKKSSYCCISTDQILCPILNICVEGRFCQNGHLSLGPKFKKIKEN